MKRWQSIALFIVSFFAGTLSFWYMYPRLRVAYLLAGNSFRYVPHFRFFGKGLTPAQTVSYASPDFSYLVCQFDFSQGPVRVKVPEWGSYQSVGVYDVDAFHVSSAISASGGAIDVVFQNTDPKAPNYLDISYGFFLLRRLQRNLQDPSVEPSCLPRDVEDK